MTHSDVMKIGGVSAEKIAGEYGTPIFVYEAEKIRQQYRKLEKAFRPNYDKFRVNFAVKSNFNPNIVELLVEEGAGLDCASKAEILLAQELDVDEVMYTAPYNKEEELNYALNHGATVNLDSIFLLDKLNEVPERACFRIDPGISGGDFGVIADGETKFGVPRERAVEAYRRAKEKGVEEFGIHMMTGSNIRNPEYFGKITEALIEIAGEISSELGIEFEFVDIGGGLGIPYHSEQEELDLEKVSEEVTNALTEGIEKYEIGNPELVLEPGRYLVAQSGHLLTKVTGIKEKAGKKFVGIDTGMHHNLRPMLLDAYHEIKPVRPVKGREEVVDIVGPVCTSVDVIAEEREMPRIKQEDILSIEDIGAYGFVMASHWNSRPLPPELMVEDGDIEVIREGENLRDIFNGTKLE